METIDLIREYLSCDYGDMITAAPMSEGVAFNWQGEGIAAKTNEVYRVGIKNGSPKVQSYQRFSGFAHPF